MAFDWTIAIAVIGCCVLWAIVGFEFCRGTHKQRGIEADRPPTDVLPIPPAPVVVPDTIPDWLEETV